MKEIILASGSPRRKQLLENLGLRFTCAPTDLDEKFIYNISPVQNACMVARQKAAAASDLINDGLVISADTVVVCRGKVLGKPVDQKDAFEKLTVLSGTGHEVITAICIYDAASRNFEVEYEITRVYFRNISREEKWTYIATGEPMDKAGAYGIQKLGALFVERIEGCYFNVVGLPLNKLNMLLKKYGVDLLSRRCI